jgi:mRNA-degrading endonuclease YafQ of YafQ-DinJ toxin-antitoxin module
MFSLNYTNEFAGKVKKLIRKNQLFKIAIKKALSLLEINPFYPSLHSHKIITKDSASAFSSRVTGDIRIIWNYNKNKTEVIDIVDIGGHEGKDKVYK